MSESTKTKAKALIKEAGKHRLFWLLPIVGLLLLLFGGYATKGETVSEEYNAEEYKKSLTAEVTALCRAVAGAGDLSVAITFVGKEEYVYATDLSSSGGEDYVMSSGKGLLLRVEHPEVAGVGVVCEGADDPVVREALSRLISSLVGVPQNRIAIVRGSP